MVECPASVLVVVVPAHELYSGSRNSVGFIRVAARMLVDDEWSGKGVSELCLRSWLAYITMNVLDHHLPLADLVHKALHLILLGGCRELLHKLVLDFS
jgi:hypothetical protein